MSDPFEFLYRVHEQHIYENFHFTNSSFEIFLETKDISLKLLRRHKDLLNSRIKYYLISRLDYEKILFSPDLEWNLKSIIKNQTIPATILRHLGFNLSDSRYLDNICSRIDIDDIFDNIDYITLDMHALSRNPNIEIHMYFDDTFKNFKKIKKINMIEIVHSHMLSLDFIRQSTLPSYAIYTDNKYPFNNQLLADHLKYQPYNIKDVFNNLDIFGFTFIDFDSKYYWPKEFLKFIYDDYVVIDMKIFSSMSIENINNIFKYFISTKLNLNTFIKFDADTGILKFEVPVPLLLIIDINDLVISKPIVEKQDKINPKVQNIDWSYESTELTTQLKNNRYWSVLSGSPKISCVDLELYKLPWNCCVSSNPNITITYAQIHAISIIFLLHNKFEFQLKYDDKVRAFQRYFRKIRPYLYAPPIPECPNGGPFYLKYLRIFEKKYQNI